MEIHRNILLPIAQLLASCLIGIELWKSNSQMLHEIVFLLYIIVVLKYWDLVLKWVMSGK